jgi:D-alanyl-lipoteichoic acid acyltransferase DltB (MBOAT superfamily)
MLFNSYIFIFWFLPITLAVFYLLGRLGKRWEKLAWLVLASLFFYGWWNPAYLILIIASASFNYWVGGRLRSVVKSGAQRKKGILLVFGISGNLAAIAYFKYANFFVDNANALLGTQIHLNTVILPLAISFFTFQQITYLVDSAKGIVKETSFLKYCLFVTFFPQLLAGPIVHHKEILPQFTNQNVARIANKYLAIGITIFVLGLFKKVLIADEVAMYSTPLFDAALTGYEPTFFEAWGAALAYTFQLYFDFSGYSDMAVGLAYMFGIKLPLNFFSPYKAANIIEFWRRWHISLSRFLRDYVYVPLGGNRKGVPRRYQNLLITMLLGGLWHGAGWTFVAWGALHGIYLVINNLWRDARARIGIGSGRRGTWGYWISRLVTFLAVVVAWVIFRAENFSAATSILYGMSGFNGFALPYSYFDDLNLLFGTGARLHSIGWDFSSNDLFFGGRQVLILGLLLWLTWFVPNTYQVLGAHSPAMDISVTRSLRDDSVRGIWFPSRLQAVGTFVILLAVLFHLDSTSEFLYFQF